MIDPTAVPEIASDESLARFIVQSKHVRKSNQTVRPDAFIPHPYRDLSVSRHLQTVGDELWSIGVGVAKQMGKTLYGRADILAADCSCDNLTVVATPLPDNPNHAEVSKWPADYDEQKAIALELAARATYVALP